MEYGYNSCVVHTASLPTVYDINKLSQCILCFPPWNEQTSIAQVCHHSAVIMALSTRRFLSPQDIDRTVDKPLTDSKTSVFYSDDETSAIGDLPVYESLTIDESENEDSDSAQSAVVYRVWHVLLLSHGRHGKLCRTKRTICQQL
jgi:hypothetical protein